MRQPGPQNPGKYPHTGPNYAQYGEQPGYIYYPWTDEYYIDPQASNEFLEEQGARKPEKDPPSTSDQVGTAAAIAGGTAIASAVGAKLIDWGFGEGGKPVTEKVLKEALKEVSKETGQQITAEAAKQITDQALESGAESLVGAGSSAVDAGAGAVTDGAAAAVTPQAQAAANAAEAGGQVAAAGGSAEQIEAAANEAGTATLTEAGWSYADIAAEAVKWAAIAYEAYQFYQIHEDDMMDGGEKAQQATIQAALIVADVWTGGMASLAYGAAKQFDEFNEFEEGFLKYDLGAQEIEKFGDKVLGDTTKNTEYKKIMQASDGGYLDGVSAMQLARKQHGVDHIQPEFDKEFAAAKGYDETEQERIFDYATKIHNKEFEAAEENLMGEDIWGYSDFIKEADQAVGKNYMTRIDGSDEHYRHDETLTQEQRYMMAQALADYNRINGGESITGDKGTYDFHVDDVLKAEWERIAAGEQYDPSRIGGSGPMREMPDIKDLGVWNQDIHKLRELWEEGGLDWNDIPEEFVKGRVTPEQFQMAMEHYAKVQAQRAELMKTAPSRSGWGGGGRKDQNMSTEEYRAAYAQWERENAHLIQMLDEGKLIYPDEGAPDAQPGGKPEGGEPFNTDPEETPPPPPADTQSLNPQVPAQPTQNPVPTPRGGFTGNSQQQPPQQENQMNTRRYSFPQQQPTAATAGAQAGAAAAAGAPTIISQNPQDAAAAQVAMEIALAELGGTSEYPVDPGFNNPAYWPQMPSQFTPPQIAPQAFQPLLPQQPGTQAPATIDPGYHIPQQPRPGAGSIDPSMYQPAAQQAVGGFSGGQQPQPQQRPAGYEPDPDRPGHWRRRR